jgi:xanthine/CO dehydrogenase XdhC/CoxF family maturation factor
LKSLLQILQQVCAERSQTWALATLVRTRGSTYRKPGARLLVDSQGGMLGVLTGGCLEEEIARYGLNVIRKGVPELLVFDGGFLRDRLRTIHSDQSQTIEHAA